MTDKISDHNMTGRAFPSFSVRYDSISRGRCLHLFVVRPSASAGIPSTGVWATRSDVSSDEINDYLQNHPYQSDFIAGTSAFKASTPRSVYEGSLASDRFRLLPVPMGMVSLAAPPSTCRMSFRSYPATSFVGSIYLLGGYARGAGGFSFELLFLA